jgi:hypothetical protein
MHHIDQRIEAEERRARDDRACAETAAIARASTRARRVTFHADDRGSHLTICGLVWKRPVGLLLLVLGACLAWFLDSEPVIGMCGLAACAAGIPLVVSPRSTIHLFASPRGFAEYTRSLDRPHYVGRHDSLQLGHYEWQGRTGVSIRVWNSKYWCQQYMGISHPADFGAVAEFNAVRRKPAASR